MTAVGDRVVVRLDLFPAKVSVASTSYMNVRAILTDHDVQIWRLGPSGPEIVWQREVIGPVEGAVSAGLAVPTDAGEVWLERSGGCGCGSGLKNVNLFPGHQVVVTGLAQ